MARRKVLAGYTVFVDGVDYLGIAAGFTPPTVEAETVTSDMPGHTGPFEIPTGRLAATMTVSAGRRQALLTPGLDDGPLASTSRQAGRLRRASHSASRRSNRRSGIC